MRTPAFVRPVPVGVAVRAEKKSAALYPRAPTALACTRGLLAASPMRPAVTTAQVARAQLRLAMPASHLCVTRAAK